MKTILLVVVWLGSIAYSQRPIDESHAGGGLHVQQADIAALESTARRADLPCTVMPIKPKLDLDFVFHSGFRVIAQLQDLNRNGQGNELTTLFRVVPENTPRDPTYMSQKLKIPAGEVNEKTAIEINGTFILGEGKYRVDWLMRDKEEHICSASWDADARLAPKESLLADWIPKGLIQPGETDIFRAEPPVLREPREDLLNVDVIVNFSPGNPVSVTLDPNELQALVDILHRISRDPHFGSFSLVVCSLATRKVLFKQEISSRIDFPAIRDALRSLKLGSVTANQLGSKDGLSHFVADIIREASNSSRADAVILVGTKTYLPRLVSREIADSLKDLNRPLFYLSYNSDPVSNPWSDPLGKALKQSHGLAYEVTRPRDLFKAWTDIVSRIVRAKRP